MTSEPTLDATNCRCVCYAVHVRRYFAGRCWALAVAVAAAMVTYAIGLEVAGRFTRVMGRAAMAGAGAEVLVVRTNADVVRAWHARGVRGRVVVDFGRFLHFVEDETIPAEAMAAPGRGRVADAALLAAAGPRNYLRIAAELDIARRVEFVSPPAALDARLSSIGRAQADLPLDIDDGPLARELDAAPPAVSEPVLVDVNASWFDEGEPALLVAELRTARMSSDLVTVSLAEDSTDVSDRARERARAFAHAIGSP